MPSMQHEGLVELVRQNPGFAAEAVLAVRDVRGIAVPADIRGRVIDCADTDRLGDWLIRAATATTLAEVFA